MSWFDAVSNPESITLITTSLATILGVLAKVIYAYKAKKKPSIDEIADAINKTSEACRVMKGVFNNIDDKANKPDKGNRQVSK